MKRKIFLILALCFIIGVNNSFSQSHVKTGDKLPELKFYGKVDNKDTLITAGGKKLLILDFWNIWCASCISAMPKLDSIQKEMGNEIQLVFVTKNSEEEANRLFKRTGLKAGSIPYVYADTLLSRLFPHQGEPFHVWIHASGKILHQTHGYNTNRYSIRQYLREGAVSLAAAPTMQLLYSPNQSLMEIINSTNYTPAINYSLLFPSKILSALTVVSNTFTNDATSGLVKRIKLLNSNVADMFRIAYHSDLAQNHGKYIAPITRLLYEGADTSFYQSPSEGHLIDEWKDKHEFCYEINNPDSNKDSFELMREDLSRYLPYVAKIEIRKVECYVIKEFGNSENYISKLPAGKREVGHKGGKFRIFNGNIFDLENGLSGVNSLTSSKYFFSKPVIADIKYSGPIDIELNSKLGDFEEVKRQLNAYGLDLVKKSMNLKMLVIQDKERH
ncbi:hypothetical protein [Sphingobacterium sp.]|uniref:TlpA family protein disulfide reductase n=1 Tax=Sphingobacterium sp. TaxID=341027 RepID=UPI00289CA07F|nr:hypothetical protein [Sphingobacterium sp.]